MSMDECCDVDSPKYEGPLVFLACGRWFLAFYRWAFGYGACPVISGIMAGVFLSHALVLQTGLLKVRSTLGRYAYGVLYLCIMQWIWVERFSMITDGLGLACLLCTVAGLRVESAKSPGSSRGSPSSRARLWYARCTAACAAGEK